MVTDAGILRNIVYLIDMSVPITFYRYIFFLAQGPQNVIRSGDG